ILRLSGRAKYPKRKEAGWLRFIIIMFPFILWAVEAWKYSIILPGWICSVLIFMCVLIPAVWLLRMASGHLWRKHKGRNASVISFSSSVTMPFIMLVELLVMIIAIVLLAAFSFSGFFKVPESMSEIEELLNSPLAVLIITIFVAGV